MKGISGDQTKDYAKSPGESVQSVFARDVRPPPSSYRETSYQFLGDQDIPIERYISPEWHALEVKRVWRKTWQVACRIEEIPNAGDYFVYDIVDDSVLIVRTSTGDIKAYINACLHRGNMLCLEHGNAKQLRCPFHGFTWSLEGVLRYITGQWDFPHIDREKFHLPEVKVGTWGGFVFVNLDPAAPPLRDYLEILPDHLEGKGFESRYKAIHVSQVVPCNWKVVQEAFIEGYYDGYDAARPDTNVMRAEEKDSYDDAYRLGQKDYRDGREPSYTRYAGRFDPRSEPFFRRGYADGYYSAR